MLQFRTDLKMTTFWLFRIIWSVLDETNRPEEEPNVLYQAKPLSCFSPDSEDIDGYEFS